MFAVLLALLAISLAMACTGCKSEGKPLAGREAVVTLYSGGQPVRQWVTRDKISFYSRSVVLSDGTVISGDITIDSRPIRAEK